MPARLLIKMVSSDTTIAEVKEALEFENEWIQKMMAEGGDGEVRVSKEMKPYTGGRDIVIEASPNIAIEMIRKGKIAVNYEICRVRLYLVADQFYHDRRGLRSRNIVYKR